jgi:hypothetical protein
MKGRKFAANQLNTNSNMRKITFLTIFGGLLFFFACKNDSGEGVQEIRGNGHNASVIANPASAEEPMDTNKLARMRFEEVLYNFGTVKEGTQVEHKFKFTNTGKVPLVIANCKATCGCTIPEWPKDEVQPGATAEIKATFNTYSRPGNARKGITITANTFPSEFKIFLEGTVTPTKPQ